MKEWGSLLSDSSVITYPAGLYTPQKMCYQPSVFLIQRKCPASLLMSYLYMETVQFKLSLDSLGEIYQLNHWKVLNLRRQPLSLLTSAQSESISSAPGGTTPETTRNLNTFLSCHNFFSLSSVQILLIPACNFCDPTSSNHHNSGGGGGLHVKK